MSRGEVSEIVDSDVLKFTGVQILVSVFVSLGMFVAAFWLLSETALFDASISGFLNDYGGMFILSMVVVETIDALIQHVLTS